MILRFSDCELDTDRQLLSRGGQPVPVEPQVFDLIRLLAENPERLVTRDEIVEVVWGGRAVSESAISARIASARKAVGDDGKRQAVIRTVQRRGLQMAMPVAAGTLNKPELGSTRPVSAASGRLRYVPGRGGERLAWMVHGEGSPVVRVDAAGWSIEGEQTSPVWRETAGWIGSHYRQLRYSTLNPGHCDDGPPRIDFDAMAEDIGTVAEAAGFERFAILTESGGVHHALPFAALNPGRVTRMVIHGGYVEGRARRSGTESTDDIFRHMIDKGWQADTAQIGAAFMLPYFPEGPFEAILDASRIFQAANTRDTELAIRDAVNNADCSGLLQQVTCPVLVVHGRHDAVHPVSEARRLVEGLPDAELWIMETANHLPVAGHRLWEEYTAGLLDFLARDDL
jgi:DNA-binding winged helix-turn-helix (wHTH) protein/pimeloyl-ACP methyl ester carboxylesterase